MSNAIGPLIVAFIIAVYSVAWQFPDLYWKHFSWPAVGGGFYSVVLVLSFFAGYKASETKIFNAGLLAPLIAYVVLVSVIALGTAWVAHISPNAAKRGRKALPDPERSEENRPKE